MPHTVSVVEDRAVHTAGPIGVLVERLTQPHPDGRRSLLGALVRFGVAGAFSVGADFAVLATLHSGLHVALLWATLVGYTVSLVINYTVNRKWTFQAQADHKQTLTRYGVVVAVNVASTLLFVLGFNALGVYYLVGKLIAVAFNAVVNFLASRYWVFVH